MPLPGSTGANSSDRDGHTKHSMMKPSTAITLARLDQQNALEQNGLHIEIVTIPNQPAGLAIVRHPREQHDLYLQHDAEFAIQEQSSNRRQQG
jgi:hypothetical protein